MYSRSEASFLQRQNSVRLFGPIRGPTCGIEEDRMRKVFIEDNCKTLVKVSADVYFCNTVQWILHFSIFHFSVFNIFLNENLTHVLFFIFVMVLQLSSKKTLRMRSSSMPHVGPLIGPNKRTLF